MMRTGNTLLHNPGLSPAEEISASFLTRFHELHDLVDQIRSVSPNTVPQHQLVIGERGAGKTMLLHRIAAEATSARALKTSWQPVVFDEEQYNLGSLADLWCNCLTMLGSDNLVAQLQASHASDEEALEEAARRALEVEAKGLDRRLLLLVDNFDLVLRRVMIGSRSDPLRLRQVLQTEPWLMVFAFSSTAIEATYDFSSPFYEMFRVTVLAPLDEPRATRFLQRLGECDASPSVTQALKRSRSPIRALIPLMGGNVRTLTMMFEIFSTRLTQRLSVGFEWVLDMYTPYFKERLDDLAHQQQRVFDALARNWHPAQADQIAEALRLGPGPVSAQLHRLVDRGLVEKVEPLDRALRYQIKERLFNLWWLMRSSRRTRRRLRHFLDFVEHFYGNPTDEEGAISRLSDLASERTPELLEQAHAAFDPSANGVSQPLDVVIRLVLELARRGEAHVLVRYAVLQEIAEPLAHVLAVLSGTDPRRMEQLNQEVRRVAEHVLERVVSP